MKLAEFTDLCWREWARACGDVVSLTLTGASGDELRAEVLASAPRGCKALPAGTAGAMIAVLLNPVTQSEVKVMAGGGVTSDTAEVNRHYGRKVDVAGGHAGRRGRLATP